MLNLGNGNFRLSYGKCTNYMVEGYIKCTDSFKDNCGYVDKDGYIWIYYERKPNHTGIIPWFTSSEDGFIFAPNVCESVKKEFHIDNVRDISFETIEETTSENEELYDEEELKYMNAATSVFVPTIEEYDDFLKKVIKMLLGALKTNINKFTPVFSETYTLTNLKTALQNKTKMSTKVFLQWAELLNIDFTIIAKTNEYADKDLDGYIVYKSRTNTIEHVKDIDIKDIK